MNSCSFSIRTQSLCPTAWKIYWLAQIRIRASQSVRRSRRLGSIPKAVDSRTGETTWCSGAAALIRREAFEQINGFDERLYFMYCEDVDLSWKLWIRGWKCIYVPEAVVRHLTQDLLPGKRRTRENYFSFRNSLFLFYRFGSWKERRILWNFLFKRFVSRSYSFRSKILFIFALLDHIRYIPYLATTREIWGHGRHPWVRLTETSLSH